MDNIMILSALGISTILLIVVVILIVLLRKKIVALRKIEDEFGDLQTQKSDLEKYADIVDIDAAIEEKKNKFKQEQKELVAKVKRNFEQAKAKIIKSKQEVKQKQEEVIVTLQKANEERHNIIRSANERADEIVSTASEKAENLVASATVKVKDELNSINLKIKEANSKREEIFRNSSEEAASIVEKAELRAEEIAGEALRVAKEESQLKNSIKAMKNIVSGYGEEYLIPPQNILDDLAEEFDFKAAGRELKKVREQVSLMIKTETAAACEYVEPKRKGYAIHFVLDAFNGKVDTILSKVRHNNYGKLKQQMIDAFHLVNFNGTAFREARINQEYLDIRLEELKWAVAVHELKLKDREEQKRIKQEMREEARAKKEYEKAIKQAEKEEKLLQQAMEKARREMESATEAQKQQYETQLKELEEKLFEAEEKNQRALSMAQQTRRGHVYVISNEGSFGEKVLKIGLTRRLDPLDRVKELGDASVPFPFDVHAIIYSEDAPALENELHKRFDRLRLNKINRRKEFFETTISDVRNITEELGIEAHWTMSAEAREYRESLAMSTKENELVPA